MTDRRNAWTEEMDAALARLWAEGHTGAVIAAHFSRSRNAVIGRVHRLHLPSRPSPIPGHLPAHPAPTAIRETQVEPAKRELHDVAPVPMPAQPRVPSVRVCQYPFGDPGDPGFRFCEAAVAGAGPYCRKHEALCWAGRARAA